MRESFNFDPVRQDLRAQAKKGFAFTLAGQIIKMVIGLGPIVVLSRLLPPSEFGLVAIATSITATLGTIMECGLSAATIQSPKLEHKQVSALFWVNVGLGLAVAVLCVAIGPIASKVWSQKQLTPVIISLGLIGILGALSVQHDALLRRRLEFQKIVTRDLISQFLGVVVGITTAWMGAGVWSLILMQATCVGVSVVGLWTVCPWRPSRPGDFATIKPFLNFGTKVLGEKVLGQATKGMDAMVIGYFHGNTAVGVYSRAQGLLNKPINQALAPLMSVLRPVLSRAAENEERLQRVSSELLGIVSTVSSIVVVALMPASPGIVRIFLGSRWGDTVPIFEALTLFAFVEPCASLVGSLVIACGRPGALLKWRFFSVALIIGGLFLSAPYGTVVMAYTFALVGLLIRTPLFFWYASRVTSLRFQSLLVAVLPSTLVAGASVALGLLARNRWLSDPTTIHTAIIMAISLGSYFSLSLVFPATRRSLSNIYTQLAASLRKKSKLTGPDEKFAVAGNPQK